MIEKVRRYIEKYHMIAPGSRVIAGVSGGADSTALLLILNELKEQMDFSLEALHVEHGIRGAESIRDADFVRQLCSNLHLPFYMYPVDVPEYARTCGLGLEEAARILRYRAFQQNMQKTGPAIIALAHHMDDNAETILFQAARGSGLRGMAGMQPVRREGNMTLIRPLLCLRRREIEAFLSEKGQDHCTDSTNADTEYSRNRIRKNILPELELLNAQAVEHINETAEQLLLIQNFIEAEVKKASKAVISDETSASGRRIIKVPAAELLHLHPALRGPLLLAVIENMTGKKKDITSAHLQAIASLAKNQSGRKIMLPYRLQVRNEYGNLIFATEMEDRTREASVIPLFADEDQITADRKINCPVKEIRLPEGRLVCRWFPVTKENEGIKEIPKNKYTKWFDYDMIKSGLTIRNRRPGDYIVMDSEMHRKKLQNYLTDMKVPAEQRDYVWLLASEHEIFWVIGGRSGETGKVTQKTEIILEIRYEEENDGLLKEI